MHLCIVMSMHICIVFGYTGLALHPASNKKAASVGGWFVKRQFS